MRSIVKAVPELTNQGIVVRLYMTQKAIKWRPMANFVTSQVCQRPNKIESYQSFTKFVQRHPFTIRAVGSLKCSKVFLGDNSLITVACVATIGDTL
jgi:hypothetical protein